MLRAVSTYIFVKERLHPGLLDKLVSGGAQAIEIFGARQHLDYANRKQHLGELKQTGGRRKRLEIGADQDNGNVGVGLANEGDAAESGAVVGRGIGPATRAPVRLTVSTMSVADWSMTRWSYAFKRMRMRCCAIIQRTILYLT